MPILASFACVDEADLPVPSRAVEGTYSDGQGRPVVIERLEYATPETAETFLGSYRAGSLACGAEGIGDAALRREVDGVSWTEVLMRDGSVVQLVTVEGRLAEAAIGALRDAVGDS